MKSTQHIEDLTEKYIDEVLTEKENEQLNHLLKNSTEARQIFLSKTHFDALINESSYNPETNEVKEPATHRTASSKLSPFVSVLALAACGVLGFFLHSVLQEKDVDPSHADKSLYLAQVTHVSGGAKDALFTGLYLENKLFDFKEGVAEITMFSGAQLTVQGPASIHLNSLDEIRISHGLLSLEIPQTAKPFHLITPGGTIRSSESKFGLKVSPEGTVETHLFDGLVDFMDNDGKQLVSLDGQQALRVLAGETTRISLQPHLFPGMRGTTDNLIASGNFEQGIIINTNKFPQSFNQWSGDIAEIVGAENGIQPTEGKGMLRFRQTYNDSTPNEPKHSTTSSQVFCFIDLKKSFPNGIPEGSQLVASCKVNRVAGDERTDNRFNLRLSVLSELPKGTSDTFQSHFESAASKSIDTDSDPSTWENLTVIMNAQPTTQYVSLEISALENIHNSIEDTVELDGHYLDDLKLTLLKPPTPAPVLVTSL